MTTVKLLSLLGICVTILGGGIVFIRNRSTLRTRRNVECKRSDEAAGVPPNPRDFHYAIALEPDGVTVTDLRSPATPASRMLWTEVARAVAFKRDLGTVDCICLFFARADGTGIELDEEMAGWSRLIEALPQYLPGCAAWSNWFAGVAFPAFATSETEIFVRQG